MFRRLDIYLFKEMFVPFILASGILSIILLTAKSLKLVELVVNHGVGISIVLKFLFFLMPSFLIYIIPMSFLISVLIAFNRLSCDSEITAMKTSGISLFRLASPVFLMAVIAFLLSAYINIFAFPWANLSAKKLLYDVARTKAGTNIKERTFLDTFDGTVLYINHIAADRKELEGIMISEEREGDAPSIIIAKNGTLIEDPKSFALTLRLANGTVHKTGKDADVYKYVTFNTYDINLRLKESRIKEPLSRSNKELTLNELLKKIRDEKSQGKNTNPYIIDLHKRIAIPTAIFIFGLIGIPLGMQAIRTSSRYRGFIISLVIMLTYYTVSEVFEAFGENGKVNAVFAAWGADIIMGMFGLYIFYKASMESSIKLFKWVEGLLNNFLDAFERHIKRRMD